MVTSASPAVESGLEQYAEESIPLILEEAETIGIQDLEGQRKNEKLSPTCFYEDCMGESACHLGSIVAEAITLESADLTGETVALNDGITGYFTDATCGASCSDATLIWEQDLVRYMIAIKAGRVETLVKTANSALATVR